VSGGSFSDVAAGYVATMVPSLGRVARRVVERAALQPGQRVLDLGTGTGIGAAAALGEGRSVIGIDAAEGMLEIARDHVPGAEFALMDFAHLDFGEATFDRLLAIHSLLFADDRRATLGEWLRVTRRGGRLSLSVPGPRDVAPQAVFGEIYARHGIGAGGRYPEPEELADVAADAGWRDLRLEVDPDHAIILPDDAAFRLWRSIGSRGAATAHWTSERHDALTGEMLAAIPRQADGSLRIPFGVIYLAATR
jgi:ubiquinone/menaquinone biosynthesis C-methylase UbiE